MGRGYAGNKRYQKPAFEKAGQKLIEHYLNLYHAGIPLKMEQLQLLYDWGYLQPPSVEIESKQFREYNRDAAVDYDYIVKCGLDPEEPVARQLWLANDGNPLHPNDEFVSFIDSQLKGMSHKEKNLQFELYKLQAQQWLEDPDKITNYPDDDGQIRFVNKERRRCLSNSLYGLNKYLWLKEAAMTSGKLKFIAWMPQQVVLWILDCGFSVMIGKLRQVGFTSFIMGRAEMRVRCNKNFFAKFITENVKKAEEIIQDKLKYAFSEQPDWFKPTVHNDAPNLFSYIYKSRKGDVEGANSRIAVEAPYLTAINGGSPNETYIDECGNIELISGIINEGRPAMFWLDPETHEMVMKRQLITWGTSGNMEKAGAQFEAEYRNCIEAWQSRNFSYGIVPILIDCFSKPGITEEFYEAEEKSYYQRAKNRADEEKLKVQFHQAYPRDIEDMFLSSAETLIPLNEINDHIKRCYTRTPQPQYGRMIPVFDQSVPTPDLYAPYKIIGAIFQPMKIGDPDAPVIIIEPPVKGWRRRYFQGTDPISGETGLSDFATTIKDALEQRFVAHLRFRGRDHNYGYLQSTLLGIFYDPNIPELPEGNIGQDYIDFKKYHGFYSNVVKGSRLPKYLQTSTGGDGIKKHGGNAPYILTALRSIVEYYPDSVNYADFWIQAKTFVQDITTGGKIKYAPKNLQLNRDDVMDSVTYADICASLYTNTPPEDINAPQVKQKKKFRYVMDGNYNLKLVKQ